MNADERKRLDREKRASRSFRGGSRSVVTAKPVYVRTGQDGAFRRQGRGYVVAVKSLTKPMRKAWRGFCSRNHISYVACEWNRHRPEGVDESSLGVDTLATAFVVWGSPDAIRALWCHSYVLRMERAGTVRDRGMTKEGPAKRPVRVGPKHKRPEGATFGVVGSEAVVFRNEESGKMTEILGKAVWEMRTAR